MTGKELKQIRQELGLSQNEFAKLLGHEGTEQSLRDAVSRKEREVVKITCAEEIIIENVIRCKMEA